MPVRIEASSPPLVPEPHAGPVPPPPIAERHMYELDPALNPRAETHRINLANRQLDLADYEKYLDGWVAGLKQCRTARELAEYGKPAPPPAGLPRSYTQAELQDFARIGEHADWLHRRAYGALADARFRAAGLPVPLSIETSASAQASLGLGGCQLAAGAAVGANGPTAEIATGCKGQKLTASVGAHAPPTIARQLGVPGLVITTSGGNRLDRIEGEPFPFAPISPYVATDGRSIELGVRVGRGVMRGPVRFGVEARGGAKLNLLSNEVVRFVLDGKTPDAK